MLYYVMLSLVFVLLVLYLRKFILNKSEKKGFHYCAFSFICSLIVLTLAQVTTLGPMLFNNGTQFHHPHGKN